MNWLGALLGLVVVAALSDSSSPAPKKLPAPVKPPRPAPPYLPGLPKDSIFRRIGGDRRVKETRIEYDDYGRLHHAASFEACEWDPVPWKLVAWSDANEKAVVFALHPHPSVTPADLRIMVTWCNVETTDKDVIRSNGRQLEPDERFRHRLIRHLDDGGPWGIFQVDIRFAGETLTLFHRPRRWSVLRTLKKQEETAARMLPAPPPPPPPPPNPFERRVAKMIELQEHFEAAKAAVSKRGLPETIERAALDELDRVYQVEIAKFEEEGGNAR